MSTTRGAARAVAITPPLGTSLAGYFTDRRTTGVHDDLYASALALEHQGVRVVVVACDLCLIPEEFVAPIRKDVAARTGTPAERVLISATHTHTGPVTSGPLANAAYIREMGRRIADAAADACGHLESCSLAYGSGTDGRFAFNRRYVMRNGSVMTNPGANNLDVLRPAGPVDHSVNVLAVKDARGGVMAVVVNCTCHPDTVDGCLVSADWPGFLRATVQTSVGKSIPVLVLNGPAGDVNHFDVMGHRVVQGIDEARRIGSGFGATALDIMSRAVPLDAAPLAVVSESVSVPSRRLSEAEIAEARKTVAELEHDPQARLEGHLESQDIVRGNKAVRLMFARGVVEAAERGPGRTKKVEMSALRIGRLGILTVGGELFTEIGLAMKGLIPLEHAFVAELVNGCVGYLGTKASYQQGGYETLLGDRVCNEVEDYLLDASRRLVAGMRG